MIYNKNFFFSDTLSFNAINDDRAKTDRQQACDLFELKKSIEIRPWISLDTAAILYAVNPVFFWLTLPHKIKNFLRKWPAKYCKYNTLNFFFTYLALCRPFLEKYIKQRANNMKKHLHSQSRARTIWDNLRILEGFSNKLATNTNRKRWHLLINYNLVSRVLLKLGDWKMRGMNKWH